MSVTGKRERDGTAGGANPRPAKRGRAGARDAISAQDIEAALAPLRKQYGEDEAYYHYARSVLDPLTKGAREKVYKAAAPATKAALLRVLPLGPDETGSGRVPGAPPDCANLLQYFSAPPAQWDLDPAIPASAQGTIVHFGSGAKGDLRLLSNFANARITVRAAEIPTPVRAALQRHYPNALAWLDANGTTVFPTTEHAWQVLKMRDAADMAKFTEDGRFAWLPARKTPGDQWTDPAHPHPFANGNAADRKEAFAKGYWRKGMAPQLGIVPKMAVNPARAARLGLTMVPYAGATDATGAYQNATWPADRDAIFAWILRLKYTQNARPREILRCTGRAYLLEFGRGARAKQQKGQTELWNGMLVPMTAAQPGGKPRLELFGRNLMGRLLMQEREAARMQ